MTRTRLAAAGGALALFIAVVAALAPELLPAPLATLVGGVATILTPARLGAVAVLVGAGQLLRGADGTAGLPPLPSLPEGGRGTPVGARFDAGLRAAEDAGPWTGEAERAVREDLRDLAVEAYEGAARCDTASAERAVETGAWTEDAAAAAFVGGTEAPATPWRTWLRDALHEDGAFHRQTVRTLRAIEALDRPDAGAEVSD